MIGGAGYIGSHMVKLLKDKNFIPIVVDDLSGAYEDSLFGAELIRGNFGNSGLSNAIFSKKIEDVMHFASFTQVSVNRYQYPRHVNLHPILSHHLHLILTHLKFHSKRFGLWITSLFLPPLLA